MNANNPSNANLPPYLPTAPAQMPPAEQTRRFAQPRDLIFAFFFLLLSVATANCAVWYGPNLGLCCTLAALSGLSAAYLWPVRHSLRFVGVLAFAGALAGTISLPLGADTLIKNLTVVLILLLNTVSFVENLQLWRRGRRHPAADVAWYAIGYPVSQCGTAVYALFHRQKSDGSIQKRRTGSVLLGLLCALPVLVVLIPLLVSSDAAFEGMLNRLNAATAIELVSSTMLGLILFLLLFSQQFGLGRQSAPQEVAATAGNRGIEPVALGAFLSVVCGLYVLYLVSQLAYFFSGFSGILPAGYTVAEYARRGFFEMAAICAINLLLMRLSLALVRKKNQQVPLFIRILAVFLGVFSLILVAVAVSKMVLYMQSFGLTRLRILTTVFMLFLALTILCVLVQLFVRRFVPAKVILAWGVLLIFATNFANVDAQIARYNITHWQTGQLSQLDVDALGTLSDAVVPYLWQLAQNPDPAVSRAARSQLTHRGQQLLELQWPEDNQPPTVTGFSNDLRAYNRSTHQAQCLLQQNWQTIYLPDSESTDPATTPLS